MHTTALIAQTAADLLAAAPSPSPAPSGTPSPSISISTDGLMNFFATTVVPPLLAILGIGFLSKAHRGQVSKVLTSSGIALVGIAFVAGAATLFFAGDWLLNLFVAK